jgi:hypothetical protein
MSPHRIVFAFAILLFWMPIGPVRSIDAEIGPSQIDLAVMTMLERVRERADGGWVDGTSILRQVMESGTYSYSTRANPIPSSWTLVYTGTNCRAYVGSGETVSQPQVEALADTFDAAIYPTATSWFHPDSPPTMIDLKIYDFGDGSGGAAGYFIRSFSTRNELYVDSQDLSIADEIVAHEFEHLLHYDLDMDEEVWLDEGLADLSIRVSLGTDKPALQGHIESYEQSPTNDLLDWGDEIADYGAVYAFIAYLADHYGGQSFISDLASDLRNSVSSVNFQLSDKGFSDRFMQVHNKVKGANIADDPSYGGGIYDQGLISIGISTMEGTTSAYPYSRTVTGSVRYAGYYFMLGSGSSSLEASINSTSSVHATVLGTTTSDSVKWSANISTSGGVPGKIGLSGFGTDYARVYVIPSTDQSGAAFKVEVRPLELPMASISILPASPDGENGFYRTAPSIALDSPGSAIYYRWGSSGTYIQYSAEFKAPEGSNELQYYAVRQGIHGVTEKRSFKVDSVPPVTEIDLDPTSPDGQNGYYITSPRITLEPERNSTAFYDLGGGQVRYVGPFDLDTGSYVLRFWSVDEAGNEEARRSVNIKVDLAEPSVEILKEPAQPNGNGDFYIDPVKVTFDSPQGSVVYFRIGSGGFEKYVGTFTLRDGIHNLEYYSLTVSGKTGTTHKDTIKVDTIAPDLTYRTDPPIEPRWQNATMRLYLTLADPGSTVMLSIGGGAETEVWDYTDLTEGDYEVAFRCVDAAGNSGGTTTLRVRIDTSTPRTVLTWAREPDQGYWYQDSLPEITVSKQGSVLSPETTYYSVNGGPFKVMEGRIDGLISGLNSIKFYSKDEAGNSEQVRNRQIGLDLDPPNAAVKANRTIVGGPGPVRFDLSRSIDDNIVYQYKVDFGDGTDSGWVRIPTIVHNYTALGDYRAMAYVMDASGRTNDNEAKVRIEVLTPEEAARRLAQKDTPWLLIAILALVVFLATIAVASLVVVLVKRRGGSDQDILQAEIMDWDS